jgi:preprotein translocase subunit Sss1
MASKQRALETLRHIAALTVLAVGLVGYVLAVSTGAYFALATLAGL